MSDTEAGRALLEASTPSAASPEFGVAVSLASIIRHAVPRIEAEARSRALAEVRARVEELTDIPGAMEPSRLAFVRTAAVLAAIDEVSR